MDIYRNFYFFYFNFYVFGVVDLVRDLTTQHGLVSLPSAGIMGVHHHTSTLWPAQCTQSRTSGACTTQDQTKKEFYKFPGKTQLIFSNVDFCP